MTLKRVGIIGWRGMVGSVLMNRMVEEKDFNNISDPVFFSTSQVGEEGPNFGKGSGFLQDAEDINKLKQMNVKMRLISDGDISGALMVTDKKYNVDIFLGVGGGPEGVLAASAIDAFGGKFQGRFIFDNDKDILINMIIPGPTNTGIWGKDMPHLQSPEDTFPTAKLLATLEEGGPSGKVFWNEMIYPMFNGGNEILKR